MSNTPASSRVYFTFILWMYDFVVHFISAKIAWMVDIDNIHKLYADNINKESHLDIGVGTGLFLLPQADSSLNIDIADINPNALRIVKNKLLAKNAKVNDLTINLYEPFNLDKKYKSIGLSYVLHCLSGDKQAILEKIKDQLEKGGVFFGVTLINDNNFNIFGRILMKVYNNSGVFSNLDDTEEHMTTIINNVFPNVKFHREGRAIFFTAIK